MLRDALGLAWGAAQRLVDEDGLEMSGHVAFTAMLALFPFLVFLAALAGLVGDANGAETFVEYLFLFVPEEIARTLVPAINQVLSTPRSDLAAIGLVAALWSAMSGVDALRVSLNRAYGAVENRPYWRRKLMDFAFVLLGSIMIVLLTVAIVLGPFVGQVLTRVLGMFAPELDLWARGRYVVTLVVMLIGLVVVHHWLPNLKHRARDVLPGAVATTLLWVLAAMLFGEYLGRFANYGATYGSLAGVIAALLFFYVSAILFVYGGHLNAALYRRRKEGKREMRTMKSATLLVAFALGASVPAWSEEIGSVDTAFKLIGPNHKIVVEAFDDPKVQNVACHVSRAKKGGISGAIGTAEETSDASIACRQIGPITIKEELKDGEEVFNERRSILFKRLRVVRFLDKTRNTLVYVVYSDKLIEGSPKNSLSTVPIMPWGH